MVKALWVVGLFCVLLGWWYQDQLPSATRLQASSKTEPVQAAMVPEKWVSQVQGVDYKVEAVADYQISGLIVSKLNTDSWFAKHEDWNEFFNVMDVCMVWGSNASAGAYEKMSFQSGQWTCWFQTRSANAAKTEYFQSISNTHIVTDDAALAKRLRHMRIGDEVTLHGRLVNYSHDGLPYRKSSLVRSDTGNGACEVMYVTAVDINHRAAAWPRWLFWFGIVLWVIAVVVFVRTPHREH
ncbi:hypothetical protein LVJ82_10680 [Vitreoscilla massiliensis]|uniref:DUF4178 domain-containing protein n=1 Tax=Vitreoscilla massiliensis TaxID=1689272 RepID=A0ABY4DXZ5_9NEIS|nr:hypothetical protein [Vitreoscilla massiliensis]UOO87958.1 hypothetical protein LVJ82_10680 [Vitreoscilla massiliensis]